MSALSNLIRDYDLRVGNMELRQVKRNVYSLTVDGETVLRAMNDSGRYELLSLLTTGMDADAIGKISVVSHSMRYRRNKTFGRISAYDRNNYLKESYYPDYDNLEYVQPVGDRYARSKEVVSELLPDYHINLCDILPELYPVSTP